MVNGDKTIEHLFNFWINDKKVYSINSCKDLSEGSIKEDAHKGESLIEKLAI